MPNPTPQPMPVFTPGVTLAIFLLIVLASAVLASMGAAWVWVLGRILKRQPLLPTASDLPRRVPWGPGSLILVVLAWVAANFGAMFLYAVPLRVDLKHWEPLPADKLVISALSNVFLLGMVPLLLGLSTRGKTRLADLGLKPEGLGHQVRTGIMSFLILTPLVFLINGLAILIWTPNKHELEKMMVTAEPSFSFAWLAFLTAVVLAPSAEELLFRGILQGWLMREFGKRPQRRKESELGAVADLELDQLAQPEDAPETPVPPSETRTETGASWTPIVITSLLFAAAHYAQWPAPLAIFFLSMGLGLVYQRTGSLVTSVVIHALFNSVSTTALIVQMALGPHLPGVPKDALPKAAEKQAVRLAPASQIAPTVFPDVSSPKK